MNPPSPPPAQGRIVGLLPDQPVWRVLVVDDEATTRLMMTELLGDMGFEIRAASDGGMALGLIADWHPHLVMLDMQMPVVDGWQVLAALRDSPLRIGMQVLACSGLAHEQEQRKLLAAGADGVLGKPFRFDELFAIFARLLPVQWRYAP